MTYPRITFNSPVILTFFLLAFAERVLNTALPTTEWLAAGGPPSLHLRYLSGLFTYPFAHGDWLHFISNFSILLLVGPILEEKYQSRQLLLSFALVTVVIGLIHTLISPVGIIGASGIVFFCIMLVSMTNFRRGELPLSLVFVALLYLSKEFVQLGSADQVSQLAHILGGVFGMVAGFFYARQ